VARWTLSAVGAALPDGTVAPVTLTVDGGWIAEVRAGTGPADVELGDGVLAPGFVDLQVNGAYRHDFACEGTAGIAAAARRLPEAGVTAFLPTFITAPVDELVASIRDAGALAATPPAGARVLGVHLEGPFISHARKGAHPPEWIVAPESGAVARLAAASSALRLVTLAPELPGGIGAIRAFTAAGAVVAIGHSDATAAEVASAADAGARFVTHLYNGQRGFHHREPGVVGAALVDDRLTLSVIADLEHVAPAALQLAFRAARGRVALVSDAISAAGMPPGRYPLSGRTLTVAEGRAPRHDGGGLAGAVVLLDAAVRNVAALGVPPAEALAAATLVPARAIGEHGLGRLEPGAAADLVWLADDLHVRRTWVAGALAWPPCGS
jgi:N-acetylglucosamine-6-phosphate deacetylase